MNARSQTAWRLLTGEQTGAIWTDFCHRPKQGAQLAKLWQGLGKPR